MSDWIDALVKEIERAEQAAKKWPSREEETRRTTVANVLGQRGILLWGDLQGACRRCVDQINAHFSEKKKVERVRVEFHPPAGFALIVDFLRLSVTVTHRNKEHTVELRAERQLNGGVKEERSGLLRMDLDDQEKPCFCTITGERVGLDGACRYILELCLSRRPPLPPQF